MYMLTSLFSLSFYVTVEFHRLFSETYKNVVRARMFSFANE